ncbi:MAG: hypothetical protein HGB17_02880 [Syntrophobacteraceae bacterium]|nr:hypothetical protein [Syntrophobacteraceae bacterium]
MKELNDFPFGPAFPQPLREPMVKYPYLKTNFPAKKFVKQPGGEMGRPGRRKRVWTKPPVRRAAYILTASVDLFRLIDFENR